MTRGGHLICWFVALLVALAPLPFGAVGPLSRAVVQSAILIAALGWILMRWRSGRPPLPWRDPLLLAGAALLSYGLFQIAPLPAGFVELLSPATHALKVTYSPSLSSWMSLSIDPYDTWASCLRIACWTLLALMVRHNALDLKGRLIVTAGAVCGGLFQAAYGLFEFVSGRQHIFGFQKKYFTDVATGTFISRNNYAGYLEMVLPLALALALLSIDRGAGARDRRAAPTLRRKISAATGREGFTALLFLMCAFLMGTALLMSRSRAGILSTAIALVAGGLAVALRGSSRRFAICSVAIAGLVVVFASQIDILPVVQRFTSLGDEFGTGFGRLQVWTRALPLLAAHPVFGTGLGTWELAFSPFRIDAAQVKVDFAHNDYLEFAAEAGALGILVALLPLVLVVARGLTSARLGDEIGLAAGLGLIALALHSMTDFHLSIPADAIVAAVLAGLCLRTAGPQVPERDAAGVAPARAVAPASTWASAACAAVLITLALATVSPAAAQIRSVPASPETAADEPEPATPPAVDPDESLCQACKLDPFNAGRYIAAGARARQRLLTDVTALLRVEADGELADLESRRYLADRIDQALALVHQGLQLSPATARGHMEAGLLHFGRHALTGLPPAASDTFDSALSEFGKALALQPWRAASYRRVARLLSPFFDECDDDQKAFISRAVRRARELDPVDEEIRTAASRMGI